MPLEFSFLQQYTSYFASRVIYLEENSIWRKSGAALFELRRNQLYIQKHM